MMKSPKAVIIILASAFCFLSLLDLAYGDKQPKFSVEGRVYCDTCRVQFITRLTQFMEGATVRLECKKRGDEAVVSLVEGKTDSSGTYKLPVEGEHEEELCDIKLISSSMPDCSEEPKELHADTHARVSLTDNNGIVSKTRKANPLGFLKEKPLPECPKVLQDLGMSTDDIIQ
ncbi:hypothetical protein Pint_10400 [Pistacia integerrima]|uniref:Uncharacterized protein n=1 Tax=Pistacia integerrima TaxID=434235 RepID=A0ACC0XID6_9ROSI|nr:hypothetical protein Pint_10400 [Pistacia integerrima]